MFKQLPGLSQYLWFDHGGIYSLLSREWISVRSNHTITCSNDSGVKVNIPVIPTLLKLFVSVPTTPAELYLDTASYNTDLIYFKPLTGAVPIDYSTKYLVTPSGGVYAERRNVSGIYMELSPATDSKGYLRVSLRGITRKVHRLVAEAFIPNPTDLPQVDHIDRNKQNNHISNLRWVTNRDNSHNRESYITFPEGTAATLFAQGISIEQIAALHNVTTATVRNRLHAEGSYSRKSKKADELDE